MPEQGADDPAVSDEQLMAFADGELDDSAVKASIEAMPDKELRLEPFIFTRELLNEIGTGVLDESPPKEMLDLVADAFAARAEGRSLRQDLAFMAAADGEESYGDELPDTPENRQEISAFAWSRAQLNRLRTGVMDEPIPESMLAVIREGVDEKTPADPIVAKEPPVNIVRDALRNLTEWFGAIGTQWGFSGVLRMEYGIGGLAAGTVLAVGLYLAGPLGPNSQLEQWEMRYAAVNSNSNLQSEAWLSADPDGFEEFSLLQFRGANENAGYESVINQMLDRQVARGLVTHTDQKKEWVILRGIEKDETTDPTSASSPDCFVGEVIEGELADLDDVQLSRILRFCPAAEADRFTFLN